MRWASTIGVALCALALAQGCIVLSDFEPVGAGAPIRGSWTIDGAAPTAQSCDAVGTDLAGATPRPGASLVRVVFLDGTRPVVHGNLIFQCVSGSFDTSGGDGGTPQRLVALGQWMVRVQAIDGAGNVLDSGATQAITSESATIDLAPVDFGSAQISARWTVAGQPASVAGCDAAGVDEIEIAFSGTGAPPPHRELCAVGVGGRHLRPGTYDVTIRALGPGGVVAMQGPQSVAVASGEHRQLGPIDLR